MSSSSQNCDESDGKNNHDNLNYNNNNQSVNSRNNVGIKNSLLLAPNEMHVPQNKASLIGNERYNDDDDVNNDFDSIMSHPFALTMTSNGSYRNMDTPTVALLRTASSCSSNHEKSVNVPKDGLFLVHSDHNTFHPVHDDEQKPIPVWKQRLYDWLYPPDTPHECQLFRLENIAVPACYLLVGLLQGLSAPLINVLPLDLGATEAQQATISSIRGLPSCFKLFFGFLSDIMPIAGYRRKPYMLFGWGLASISSLSLLLFSNLHIPARNSGCFEADYAEHNNNIYDDEINLEMLNAPSIPFLSLCLLGFGIGFWIADVMGDSIVAEKAKLELPEHRGSLQSSCYACRFFGIMVAAPFSTYLYSSFGPHYVVLLLSIMPLTIIPLIWYLYEKRYAQILPVREQCSEIWNTVCSRAVWQPLGFVYLYNIMQVSNAAWREFLVTALHFTSCQLNLILITAYVLLYLGIISYKYCFITWSWRTVYIATTILGGFFSILQVLLIKGITFGLSPFLFALGDDAFADFISGIHFLPTTIMMVHLCPVGSEGASYAMFTTVNNSALNLSGAISTQLLKIWDVSRSAFEDGQYDGIINLTYLTTAVQVSAIVFVGLLPRFKEDLMALKNMEHSTSKVGGTIFLFITFSSIIYAIIIGLLNIISPGWMGES